MEGLETTPYLLFPCGAILWQECIQMSRGQKPYASISWIGQSTMFTPHSSVQRQTSLGEPRSVSCCLHLLWPMTMCVRVINTFRIWPARKWEGKLWQRNKLWLLCFLWLPLPCFLLWILVEPVFNHMHSLTKGRQGLNVNEVMKRLQEVGGLQTSLISNPPIHQQRIFKVILELTDILFHDGLWKGSFDKSYSICGVESDLEEIDEHINARYTHGWIWWNHKGLKGFS